MRRKKAVILLPTAYNDGTKVPPEVMSRIFRELQVKFAGYSQGGLVRGTYTMEDGTLVNDKSIMVWFILPDEEQEIEHVRRLAAKFARWLRQETLYLEVMDVDAEFVHPDDDDEGESS
jgi:hypothetical protein